MVNVVHSLPMVLMMKCALSSYAGHCTVGTSFRRIWLKTCIREVVMNAWPFILFLYSNQIWFNRNIIKEYSIDFSEGPLQMRRQSVR